ncbi:ThuA domain-containing protein [Chitinophaga sedimenti]|uniref:ThuA domain-containing protein n=1 Tax=Chitinophaga sedimenti TaxID=2033606 RepID=UPI0027E0C63C|nr:ThuA domain-containing protein [Chitinophaga sedimenti]
MRVEVPEHPLFKDISKAFNIKTEEWYTYDKSPRPQVTVLANVEEDSYRPASDKKMGDHPVIWTNPKYKARNVYIFMGHSPDLFDNAAYKTLFRNAIFWAAQ